MLAFMHAGIPAYIHAQAAAIAPKGIAAPIASRRFEELPTGRQKKLLPSRPQRLPPLCAIIRTDIAAMAT